MAKYRSVKQLILFSITILKVCTSCQTNIHIRQLSSFCKDYVIPVASCQGFMAVNRQSEGDSLRTKFVCVAINPMCLEAVQQTQHIRT